MRETPSSDISAPAKATRDRNKGNEGNKRNPGPEHCPPDPVTENQELLSTMSPLEGNSGGKPVKGTHNIDPQTRPGQCGCRTSKQSGSRFDQADESFTDPRSPSNECGFFGLPQKFDLARLSSDIREWKINGFDFTAVEKSLRSTHVGIDPSLFPQHASEDQGT